MQPGLPFRPFFLLAALDAMLGIAVWLPGVSMASRLGSIGLTPGDWHRNVLLFGTIPAVLAGFLLTALPRWTGRRVVTPVLTRALAALWLSGQAASLVSKPAGLIVSAAFVAAVSSVAAVQVLAARDRRDLKVVGLLYVFCGSIVLTAAGFAPASYRLAVASLLGLVMVIGGRVTPALTGAFLRARGAFLRARGAPAAQEPSRAIERFAAATAGGALMLWVFAPQHPATGVLSACAAAAQAARLLQWQGWRSVASPAVTALHVGYGWIVAGFTLLAIDVLGPNGPGQAAAVHAWTVGAIGTMSIAIMASMMRKHSGRPFARSSAATAAFFAITACAVARILAELFPASAMAWTGLSATCWIAAFVLFLWAFRTVLLRR